MSPVRMDRAESGLRLTLQFVDAVRRRDLKTLAALVSEPVIFEPSVGPRRVGREAVVDLWRERFLGESQGFLVEETLCWGPRCLVRTNQGERLVLWILRTSAGVITEVLEYTKG